MSRYIDADAFYEDMCKRTENDSWRDCWGEFAAILSNQPTADVVPKDKYDRLLISATKLAEAVRVYQIADVVEVVHGQWTNTTHGLICSACKTYQVYGNRFYNFCPVCGADMRGERNEI